MNPLLESYLYIYQCSFYKEYPSDIRRLLAKKIIDEKTPLLVLKLHLETNDLNIIYLQAFINRLPTYLTFIQTRKLQQARLLFKKFKMKRKWLTEIKQYLLDVDDMEWHDAHLKHIKSALYHIEKIIIVTSEKTLLIFDLNGVLINKKWDKENGVQLWKQPDLNTFLEHIFKHYDVAIWSSAKSYNVRKHITYALGDYVDKLIFVLDQSHCIKTEDDVLLKNLSVVWDKYPQYNRDNTIIIDDSDEKMVNNPVECHFNPGTWDHEKEIDTDLLYNKFNF